MEKLYERRKYLKTFLGIHAPPKDGQHFPERPTGEADSNISTPRLRFAYN